MNRLQVEKCVNVGSDALDLQGQFLVFEGGLEDAQEVVSGDDGSGDVSQQVERFWIRGC